MESKSLYVFMVFLPPQSINVATARLFPYLGSEGQTNAVATDRSFLLHRLQNHTHHGRAAADGGRLNAFLQAK